MSRRRRVLGFAAILHSQSVFVIRASYTMGLRRVRLSVDPKLLAIFMIFVAHYCEPIAEPSDIFANQ